jgi:5-methylthioadenosine/S-adenosylhomocysteine deaminase
LLAFLPKGPVEQLHDISTKVLEAYRAIGMRASYSFTVRDQNKLVYEADSEFLKRLPAETAKVLAAFLATTEVPFEDFLTLFETLSKENEGQNQTRIQLAPSNLQWCSDDALLALKQKSDRAGVPMHMHLLETAYQKEYAHRRTGTTAVKHPDKLGLLGPSMTLGHGVQLTEGDIETVVTTDTCLCHNCSSNFRLRSGIAPLNVCASMCQYSML